MDEVQLNDLKQFISVTVSQSTAEIKADVAELKTDVAELKIDVAHLKSQMDTVHQRFDDMDLKLDTIADAHADSLDDHEKRITRLEKTAAQ